MAIKKPATSALEYVLEVATELLENAKGRKGAGVIVGAESYLRLRAAVRQATGVTYGVAAKSREDADDDDADESQEVGELEDDDSAFDEGDDW